jgi:fatty acid desaturase
MLRHAADRRTLAYMAVTTALFFAQWQRDSVSWALYAPYLFLSVAVAIIAHNHNHLPVFRNAAANQFVDYWLTVFYGFPAFGWIPTHNKNHHVLNNRAGDYTITYRYTEANHLGMLLAYPSVSSYFQQKPIRDYLAQMKATDRAKYWACVFQYVFLAAWIGVALVVDWRKALIYVIAPQQFALFAVLVFNFVQHVHTDEESPVNHSRNFVSPLLNALLFNNGYHTVHHDKAGTHWSRAREAHEAIAHRIDPSLNEPSFWWYIARVYLLGAFVPRFRTTSMRLARLAAEASAAARAGAASTDVSPAIAPAE